MAATRVMVVRPWEGLGSNSTNNSTNKNKNNDKGSNELSEEVMCVARKELREDEKTRTHALDNFRDWILKNRDLKDIRTDDNFLLRFLRVKKFSLPMAQDMLLKFLNMKQMYAHLCGNLDYLDPPILELINKGFYFVSPVRDQHGRRVTIGIANNFDPHKYTNVHMAKVMLLTFETLLEDEETQIMGFTHFVDVKNASTAHVTLWNVTEFATMFKWGEHSYPMRHKSVHLLNVHPALKYVYDFAKSRVTQKIKDRFKIHNSLSEVHADIDPSALPKEYGGVIPMADMIESWKLELGKQHQKILYGDKMKLLDNSCVMKKKSAQNNNIGDISGSFRKLEVD
ncbi:clavesin-2 [Cimex lectularius]|uniref:CRAL-TRIO domain-containing protein n=1 Tax=Cimex lectularius TaxID=79782 RepID=A0A8I6RHC6_CIMLE|nr:clavesin-2 [Cimex lectularius]